MSKAVSLLIIILFAVPFIAIAQEDEGNWVQIGDSLQFNCDLFNDLPVPISDWVRGMILQDDAVWSANRPLFTSDIMRYESMGVWEPTTLWILVLGQRSQGYSDSEIYDFIMNGIDMGVAACGSTPPIQPTASARPAAVEANAPETIASLSARIDDLESQIATLQADVQSINAQIEELSGLVEELRNLITTNGGASS